MFSYCDFLFGRLFYLPSKTPEDPELWSRLFSESPHLPIPLLCFTLLTGYVLSRESNSNSRYSNQALVDLSDLLPLSFFLSRQLRSSAATRVFRIPSFRIYSSGQRFSLTRLQLPGTNSPLRPFFLLFFSHCSKAHHCGRLFRHNHPSLQYSSRSLIHGYLYDLFPTYASCTIPLPVVTVYMFWNLLKNFFPHIVSTVYSP